MARRTSQADGRPKHRLRRIQLTRVGLWFLVVCGIVGVAATNTGNNALYMALAAMLSVVLLSVISGWLNLTGLDLEVEAPEELYNRQEAIFRYRASNRSRLLPKWLVQVSLHPDRFGALVSHVRRRRPAQLVTVAEQRWTPQERGVLTRDSLKLSTLFPFGLFRLNKVRDELVELVVFPQLQAREALPWLAAHRGGDDGRQNKRGGGDDLYALRDMRVGDDPRGIHWKQTARTGRMIYRERAASEVNRMAIVLDNAVLERGEPLDSERAADFERQVSEAATAADHWLGLGWEVEFVTRDHHLGVRGGAAQRTAILYALALVEPKPVSEAPLAAEGLGVRLERQILFRVGQSEPEISGGLDLSGRELAS